MLELVQKVLEVKPKNLESPPIEQYERGKILVAEPNMELIKGQSLESLIEKNMVAETAVKEVPEIKGRLLTPEEKIAIQEKTNMSDKTLESCTIDEDGNIYLKCKNEEYAGKVHENTGVEYERKTVEVNGVKIEVVVPKFDSLLNVYLPKDKILEKDLVQFRHCNEKLKEAVQNDPELRAKFTDRQLELIEKGHTPSGYTWHHDAEVGKMQLVKSSEHNVAIGGAAHTGGKAIWGGGSDNR